jgi:predicted TIM-barrel fold metal-dependent hydrolase
MVIDCHYHHEERMLKVEDLIARMDGAGVDRVALIASMTDPLPETAPILIRLLQFLLTHRSLRGVGKALAANFTEDGSIKILNKSFRICSDPDNESVSKTIEKHPEKFYGWVFVNPRGKNDPIAELEKWIKYPGFLGVKAHPFWHRYAPSELIPVAERAVRLNKPFLIHVGFHEHGDIHELLNTFPELKLILAHAAFPSYADTWKIIRDKKNVYVDLSAAAYVGERITRDVVGYLGADRCFFGTDGPYGPHAADGKYDYGFIKRRIEKLFPDDKTRRLLFGENFIKMAGI